MRRSLLPFLENKDLKETSEQAYRLAFTQFTQYLIAQSITMPTQKDIKYYKKHLEDRKLSVFTKIAYLNAVKSLFSFLSTRKLYPDIAKKDKVTQKT